MRSYARWALTLFAGTAVLVGVHRSARAEIVDGVAVVVNGDIITLSELEERPGLVLPNGTDEASIERRRATLKRAAEEAATEKLVEKVCADEGITPTPTEIDNAIEDVQRSNGNIDRPTLEKALAAQGMTMPVYREMLTKQLCQMKVMEAKVKPRISVTEDDIHALYNERVGQAHTTRELHLRDIFVPSEGGVEHARTRIEDAQKRVASGEDFAKVAKETGGPLADRAGDLGWMKESDLAPELRPVLNLPKGGVSQIIQTDAGLHLLKVEDDRTKSDAPSYPELHDQLKLELLKARMGKASEDYLEELRRNADIQYKLP